MVDSTEFLKYFYFPMNSAEFLDSHVLTMWPPQPPAPNVLECDRPAGEGFDAQIPAKSVPSNVRRAVSKETRRRAGAWPGDA